MVNLQLVVLGFAINVKRKYDELQGNRRYLDPGLSMIKTVRSLFFKISVLKEKI